jgi:hypothetical protein
VKEEIEMKHNVFFAVIFFVFAVLSGVPAVATDHGSDYRMGTLTKVPIYVGGKVSRGWTDTTSCNSELTGIHCTGGIVDDYSGWLVADMPNGTEVVIERCVGGGSLAALLLPCDKPYVLTLTEEDGTFVFLDHTWGHHDSSQDLEVTSKVLYRIEHHGGVTYIRIPDPANPKKEGTYNPIKLPKPKSSSLTPQADNNISSMCASGRLSPELTAKYCTPGTEKSTTQPK